MELKVRSKNRLGIILNKKIRLTRDRDNELILSAISKTESFQRLKQMIRDEKKLLQIAFCFRMNPTPLRKILENKPPSKYILFKLKNVLTELVSEADLEDLLFKSPRGEKLISLYRLYQKEGSLGRVGQLKGLSRERIRQLLNKGTKLGLFEYKKSNLQGLPDISKEKILEDYKKTLRLKEVAKFNYLSIRQLSQILRRHQLTRHDLKAIRLEGRRKICVHQYNLLVEVFGGHPSTTEMEKTSDGISLSNKIIRLWGSIHAFRKELNVNFSSRSRVSKISLGADCQFYQNAP